MNKCCHETYVKTLEEVKLMIVRHKEVTVDHILRSLDFAIKMLNRQEDKKDVL